MIYTHFPSIKICRKRDKNTEFNQKNATKRAFFMVKYKYIKENLKENRVVWDCEESYLPDDVKEILKNSGDKVIVETEKITTISNYIGLQGTEQTRETQEKIKAIYFVNENGKITKVLTNENDK